jgi:hypothetical protein
MPVNEANLAETPYGRYVTSDGWFVLITGDPRALALRDQEIVVVYGPKAELPTPIPSSYPFPAGL